MLPGRAFVTVVPPEVDFFAHIVRISQFHTRRVHRSAVHMIPVWKKWSCSLVGTKRLYSLHITESVCLSVQLALRSATRNAMVPCISRIVLLCIRTYSVASMCLFVTVTTMRGWGTGFSRGEGTWGKYIGGRIDFFTISMYIRPKKFKSGVKSTLPPHLLHVCAIATICFSP